LHMKQLEGKNWLDAPSVEPRVSLHVPEPGRLNLLLRIPTPAHRTSRVEQAILRRFLQAFKLAGKQSRDDSS
ncbi:MAG: mechanosensitive ion channel protein MscS, partial [Nitrospirota bacterium]